MTDRTPPDAGPGRFGPAMGRLLALLVAAADLGLIAMWLTGEASTLLTLGAHLALTAAIAPILRFLLRLRPVVVALSCLLLILLGPLGGLLLFALELGVDGAGRDLSERRDAPWRDRPESRAERICRDIRQNRRPLLDGALPRGFVDALDAGTMPERYRVISAISRHYQPEMLAALRHALASPVPVLRVQAAAVYAKLRGDFGEEANRLLSAPSAGLSPRATRVRIASLDRVVASGFVDDDLQTRLRARRDALAAQAGGDAADGDETDAMSAPPLVRPDPETGARAMKGVG